MKRLLQGTYKRVADCEKKCLDDKEYARLQKCYRKILEQGAVSGCFRSEDFAHAYCRITSYLQTMAYKGINPMIAIQMALTGEIGGE
jgi:hypothetical protein